MTLGELIDEVRLHVPAAPEDSDIVTMLNRAQVTVARDLEIPIKYQDVTDVTGAFDLPGEADQLFEVRRRKDGYNYPIYNTQEADAYHAGWARWDAGGTQFIVYDPKTVGGTNLVRPVPLPGDDAEDFVLTYSTLPANLTELVDEPFDGFLRPFHEVLAHYAIFRILLALGDERANVHFSHYSGLMQKAYGYARPRIAWANNPLHDAIHGGGS